MTIKEIDKSLSNYKASEKVKIKAQKSRLKRLLLWLRYFFILTWKWLFMTLKDWKSWIIFGCVFLTMSSSIWVGYLLYTLFKWKWALAMATGSLFFWNVIPCTPFIAICIFLTIGVKAIIEKIPHRK
jgi:hypothetical protein